MNIADRIKTAIHESRKRATEIAKECGVSRAAVSQWLKGEIKALKPENLYSLAKATGVRPEWLATGKGPMLAGGAPDSQANVPQEYAQQQSSAAVIDVRQLIVAAAEGMTAAQVVQWLSLAEQVKAGTVGKYEMPPDPGNDWVSAFADIEEGVSEILASAGLPESEVPQVGAKIIAIFDRRKGGSHDPPDGIERRAKS